MESNYRDGHTGHKKWLVISERCNRYCNECTNNVISCDYNVIMILIIIEKCSFSLKESETRR